VPHLEPRQFALPGLVAATLIAAGCRDSFNPERRRADVPAFVEVAASPALTGRGAIGQSLALPTMDRQEFDFEATGTPGGRLFVRDFGAFRTSGAVGSLTADPAVDAATGINSFTQTSAACVTFAGIGRLDNGDLVDFSVDGCDNGSPGTGVDFLRISVPAISYNKSDTLTEGEITLNGGTKGDLDVTIVTTGADLDPDGYTVTVDDATSQATGANGTVRFSAVAEGSHTVELSGVAANCTPQGSNPRTVTVVAGSVASTTFDVTCTATVTVATRVTGRGAIGDGLALPKMDRLEFDFEATSTPGGRAVVTDYSIMRDDFSAGRITVDPATDPATGITSFSRSSATCVTFGGVGRLNDNDRLYQFFIDVCDNASPGVGADTFTIRLPSRPYSKSGTLTEGDIAITTF
jgi:hypothetical protein